MIDKANFFKNCTEKKIKMKPISSKNTDFIKNGEQIKSSNTIVRNPVYTNTEFIFKKNGEKV